MLSLNNRKHKMLNEYDVDMITTEDTIEKILDNYSVVQVHVSLAYGENAGEQCESSVLVLNG